MDAGKALLQSLHEVAVVKFGFAEATKARRQLVGARAGFANGVTASAQLLQHLFTLPLLLNPFVSEGAPHERYCG